MSLNASPATKYKKNQQNFPIKNEFSRVMNIYNLGVEPKILNFTALDDELINLAQRFKIDKLKSFEVSCQMSHNFVRGSVLLEVLLSASITQSCAITLHPIDQHIRETVFIELFRDGVLSDTTSIFDEGPEQIEVANDGSIDIGEVFVQYLSLEINPYPKIDVIHDKDFTI